MAHPTFGAYVEHQPGEMIDLLELQSHPLTRGRFYVDAHIVASGSQIKNTARPDFVATVAEHADALAICDLLNLATSQLTDDQEAADANS